MKTNWAAATLSGLMVVVLIVKWMLVRNAFTNAPWTLVGSTSLVFVSLADGAAVGMLKGRSWGFVTLYVLVPVATFVHGIALIPFVVDLAPAGESRAWAVGITNLFVLVAAAVVHRATSRSDQELEQSSDGE